MLSAIRVPFATLTRKYCMESPSINQFASRNSEIRLSCNVAA